MARVLIVDDDPSVRKALGRVLEEAGHECSFASTGGEALVQLRSRVPFDLVILDFFMHGMLGGAAQMLIRDEHPGLKVLVLSGWPDAVTVEEGFELMAKPWDTHELVQKVRSMTGG